MLQLKLNRLETFQTSEVQKFLSILASITQQKSISYVSVVVMSNLHFISHKLLILKLFASHASHKTGLLCWNEILLMLQNVDPLNEA